MTAWQWLGAAVALPALGVVVTSLTKRMWVWLEHAITRSMSDAITQTVQPQLTAVEGRLAASIDNLREVGSVEHASVASRLTALEDRLTAVEAQLTPIKENPQ